MSRQSIKLIIVLVLLLSGLTALHWPKYGVFALFLSIGCPVLAVIIGHFIMKWVEK